MVGGGGLGGTCLLGMAMVEMGDGRWQGEYILSFSWYKQSYSNLRSFSFACFVGPEASLAERSLFRMRYKIASKGSLSHA